VNAGQTALNDAKEQPHFYPADFLRENLAIELNVIDAAWRNGTKKLEFLGSSCIYPKFAPHV
jgi:nucleoside-diphosphate-sugar epimerase